MKKLIEYHQPNLIECDFCYYYIPNPSGNINEPTEHYINKPCPVCGNNLLTLEDYTAFEKVRKRINFLNKWFSWLTVLYVIVKPKNFLLKIHKNSNDKL